MNFIALSCSIYLKELTYEHSMATLISGFNRDNKAVYTIAFVEEPPSLILDTVFL